MTKTESTITQKYLKECFDYNPETGALIWKQRPKKHFKRNTMNKRLVGKPAGAIEKTKHNEYLKTRLIGKSFWVHRLIWIMKTGEMPNEIDHVDGNGLNNKWTNLRNVDGLENSKNLPLNKLNTSGLMGVSFSKSRSKFEAYISINNKKINLGRHNCFFQACCARKSAEHKYGFHANHGRH